MWITAAWPTKTGFPKGIPPAFRRCGRCLASVGDEMISVETTTTNNDNNNNNKQKPTTNCKINCEKLVGGWTNPFEKYDRQNWIISPGIGGKKHLKPPPRKPTTNNLKPKAGLLGTSTNNKKLHHNPDSKSLGAFFSKTHAQSKHTVTAFATCCDAPATVAWQLLLVAPVAKKSQRWFIPLGRSSWGGFLRTHGEVGSRPRFSWSFLGPLPNGLNDL